MKTSLIILGSGQDGGAPPIGRTTTRSGPRSASSIAVVGASGSVLLFDASPDIRQQSLALLTSEIYPSGRDTWIDGIFITHAHMGHYAGLVHFGPESVAARDLPLFGTRRLLGFLEENEPWRNLLTSGHLTGVPIDDAIASIDDELAISAVPVPHRDEFSDTVAFSISVHGDPWLLYLPDIDSWDEWPDAERVIADHGVALIDASFSAVGEVPGRDMSQFPHPLVTETIREFSHLTGHTQIVLTHINHTNPIGDPEASITHDALEAGFLIAEDGMTITRREIG